MNYIIERGDFVVVEKIWKQTEGNLTLGKHYEVIRSFNDPDYPHHKDNGFWIKDDNGKERHYKFGNKMFGFDKQIPTINVSPEKVTTVCWSKLSIADLIAMKNEHHRIFDARIDRHDQESKDVATQCVSRNQKVCRELELRFDVLFEGENIYDAFDSGN